MLEGCTGNKDCFPLGTQSSGPSQVLLYDTAPLTADVLERAADGGGGRVTGGSWGAAPSRDQARPVGEALGEGATCRGQACGKGLLERPGCSGTGGEQGPEPGTRVTWNCPKGRAWAQLALTVAHQSQLRPEVKEQGMRKRGSRRALGTVSSGMQRVNVMLPGHSAGRGGSNSPAPTPAPRLCPQGPCGGRFGRGL